MTRYILKKPLLGTITLLLSVTLLSGCFEQTSTQKVLFKPVYENMRLNCESDIIIPFQKSYISIIPINDYV